MNTEPTKQPEQAVTSDTPRTMAFIASMCPFVECEWTMGAEKLMCEMETDLTAAHKRVQRLSEALEKILDIQPDDQSDSLDYWAYSFGRCEGIAKQALAETENGGEQP